MYDAETRRNREKYVEKCLVTFSRYLFVMINMIYVMRMIGVVGKKLYRSFIIFPFGLRHTIYQILRYNSYYFPE